MQLTTKLISTTKSIDYLRDNFTDWYVLYVPTNKEFFIKQLIDKYAKNRYKIIIFFKDVIHINQNKIKKIKKTLFPGYIFIQKNVEAIINITKKILPNYYIKPISFNDEPSKVEENEMRLLFFCCNDQGVFEISNYYKKEDTVIIVDGPLKNLNGKIKFLNEKKQKVNIEISLFNRKMNLSLGIKEIKKKF